jgi:molybdate transport system ATP-binding protein
MISVHGHVSRGDLRLDLDLDLAPGASFVVGPNGAGKTTLLRLLAGLEALDSGHLEVDGVTLDAPHDGVFAPAHARPIATAFQDHRLLPHLDLLDNVAFGARRAGMPRAAAREEARRRLAEVGMADLAGRRPRSLSVGQRQRASIARALARPAQVLLLDEPLAAVDEDGRGFLRDRLRDTPHRHVVWVSHDPDDLAPDDRRISVADGRVRQTRSA